MARVPAYLFNREIPNEELLNKIKTLTKEGKSPRQMKDEIDKVSLYTIRQYYSKIKRGIW